ncbi:translation elongation factor [Pseudonocardia sp. EC080610-09]|uniref:selenocysteine-specific translation elongation factor n=1 Tax=unclassified Pseudonocardia TaxID=2619320 RepID=UPI0007059E1E|nr:MULTISPECIES: selenocysteine-specific translation elongation factor [unclassified Pseudonocardia]ALL78116.1 translation elongation factor [Pseudonocardia sp. EC080610-09]ALL81027.1 translation elongation factor [Pseudonocardia sp. EC080619-01]
MHVLCTAGHVDHGKSTLVRALTGMEPDRYAEERRRGMTIDLGFAWTTLTGPGGPATVAFVDVPGHERFVTTMLAGAGPVPAALFVVAADEGWMPQSGEHADALAAAGITRGLLVVTRTDLLDPELALDDARAGLAARGLGGWPAVAVSAATGDGLDTLRAALVELVAALPPAAPDGAARLWVDRAFTVRGSGTVVTGTLGSGTVRTGDELELDGADGRHVVTVRAVQELGAPVDAAGAVARVALNLRGVPRDRVRRGDVLLARGAWPVTTEADVRLHGVGGPPPELTSPTGLTLHAGSAAVPVRVRPLGDDVVRIRPEHPLPLRIGDRAVLRDPGAHRIVAGVTVLDPAPPPLRRRGAARRRAGELAAATGVPDAAAELARRGAVPAADLVRWGVPGDAVAALGTRVPGAAGWLLDPAAADAAVTALERAVAAHDASDPLDPGLPLAAARREAGLPDAGLVEAALARAAEPRLVVRDGRVRPAADAGPPEHVLAAAAALRADLAARPFTAPKADRLAGLGLGQRELAALERAGELLRLTPDVVLLPDAPERALEVLRGLGEEFTASTARQALGTSRRVVVPLLELLGRTGRTVRTPSGGHRLR